MTSVDVRPGEKYKTERRGWAQRGVVDSGIDCAIVLTSWVLVSDDLDQVNCPFVASVFPIVNGCQQQCLQ